MADKIRWGILSTAKIGRQKVTPAIMESSNGEVVAVASRNLERAQGYADEFGISEAFGSYEELFDKTKVDAIYNPLPNSEHAKWSIYSAEVGIPMLCEKPLARDGDEAQLMVDAFAKHDVLFAEAFMYRFHPQSQHVKQLVEEGSIGELRMIKASFSFTIGDENNIRLSKPLAGGSVMDVGCYCINVMRFMIGEEPMDAKAFATIGEATGVDETMAGILQFPSGVFGHFDSSLRIGHSHTYELRGTGGRIEVPEGFTMPFDKSTTIRLWQDGQYQEVAIPPANSYTLMAEDFAQALIDNHPPRYAPQDGVNNMRVIDKLYASIT